MPLDLQAIRAQFPSMHQAVSEDGTLPLFLDNPAGTQVPQAVMDAVTHYYMHSNANQGGFFTHSQRTDAVLQEARDTMAAFVNAPRADEIVFGPNMTTLNFGLSRALAHILTPEDEIVLTRMDHDANVAPWLLIAREIGCAVKWVDIHVDDGTLNMDSLEEVLSQKTKIVAAVHASNALGTLNPVEQIADMAHTVQALFGMDAVQSAPHILMDVQAIGCDFMLCSAYKFFGPHVGIMWGRYELLESLPAYKVRPSKNEPPFRWETGTPSFETIAATTAAVQYLASLGSAGHGLRAQLIDAFSNIEAHEQALAQRLLQGLQSLPGITIAGLVDATRLRQRVPTIAFALAGHNPDEVAAYLGKQHVYVWSGDYYAQEVMQRLGHGDEGMVRVGAVHYNTFEEIDRFLRVLADLT